MCGVPGKKAENVSAVRMAMPVQEKKAAAVLAVDAAVVPTHNETTFDAIQKRCFYKAPFFL